MATKTKKRNLHSLSPDEITTGIEEIAQAIHAEKGNTIEEARREARCSGLWATYAASLMSAALAGKKDVNIEGLKLYNFERLLPGH